MKGAQHLILPGFRYQA